MKNQQAQRPRLTRQLAVRLDPGDRAGLERLAAAEDRPLAHVVRRALRAAITRGTTSSGNNDDWHWGLNSPGGR